MDLFRIKQKVFTARAGVYRAVAVAYRVDESGNEKPLFWREDFAKHTRLRSAGIPNISKALKTLRRQYGDEIRTEIVSNVPSYTPKIFGRNTEVIETRYTGKMDVEGIEKHGSNERECEEWAGIMATSVTEKTTVHSKFRS